MCIKTVKITQRCEKPQGEASMEAWSTKNGVGENGEDEVAALPLHADLISWSYHPCHSYLQTCHSYLQNCHSATQIYKNATLGPQMLTH